MATVRGTPPPGRGQRHRRGTRARIGARSRAPARVRRRYRSASAGGGTAPRDWTRSSWGTGGWLDRPRVPAVIRAVAERSSRPRVANAQPTYPRTRTHVGGPRAPRLRVVWREEAAALISGHSGFRPLAGSAGFSGVFRLVVLDLRERMQCREPARPARRRARHGALRSG